MRRDFIFIALIVIILGSILLFFVQTGAPETAEVDGGPRAEGGPAATPPVVDGVDPAAPPRSAPEAPSASETTVPDGEAPTEEPVVRRGSSSDAGLDTLIPEVDFEDTELGDVLDYLTEVAGLSFDVPDDLLRGDEAKVTLRAEDITAKNVLMLIVMTKGLSHEVTPDGTVRIRREE